MVASPASSRLYHLVHPPYATHFRIPIPLSGKTTCRHWRTFSVEVIPLFISDTLYESQIFALLNPSS